MMYADYSYYTDSYYGNKIASGDFNRLASRASDFMDYYTRGKLASHADCDAVKKCCCALAEEYQTLEGITERSASGELASETVGSYSVSYRNGEEVIKSARTKMADIIKMYLGNIGNNLFYRGGSVVYTTYSDNL